MHSPDPLRQPAADVITPYLHHQAAEFLRSLRLHRESGPAVKDAEAAARALRHAARRISGTLHTFRPLLKADWADGLRTELAWLSGTLAVEHACAARLTRLLAALDRLNGTGAVPAARVEEYAVVTDGPAGSATATAEPAAGRSGTGRRGTSTRGALTVGAARAGALLERQLTLARTRAHSAALQALGSSRFHAVADAVALLASEVPLGPAAASSAAEILPSAAEPAERRLAEAVAALPLSRAAHPYNAEALVNGLADADAAAQDTPWHQVRDRLRLHRYAREVLRLAVDERLTDAARALDRHRDAAEAAVAAAAAARTPRIAPATAYALGVLHADQRHEVEAARFAFQQVWQKAVVTAS
ncbi:CHAD domain-containing protein [Streptomyces sannanensis]|uniref:CHAD domain-containing protein n=1 Tax=Streptomyces sannanensis TaxID=285536 RepID=A0ABP6SBN2_9ACTN